MLFNSDIFLLVFLPIVYAGYVVIARRNSHFLFVTWIVCASLFFYAWWNPKFLALLLFSIAFNFAVGRYLREDGEQGARARKAVLIAAVGTNLGLIGYFKYAGFLAGNAAALTGLDIDLGEITLPLAISFFTFQQISYLVDSYRGETGHYRFLDYAFYVSFFPQLIAGPIVYHRDVMGQIAAGPPRLSASNGNLAAGLTLLIIGLGKKVLIADSLSLHAEPVFAAAAAGESLAFADAWTAALAYTFQIYFDFSGYSDMAIGLGRLFGIRLPLNFNSPYKAGSIIEFWKRWHMTLSRFLRDYLYFSLGGNRKGHARRYGNLLITMALGGLWHGAAWTFVFWGIFHGLLLAVNHAWRQVLTTLNMDGLRQSRAYAVLAQVLTFGCVLVAWVMFRAADTDAAMRVYAGMLGASGFTFEGFDLTAGLLIVASAMIAFWLPNSQEWLRLRAPGKPSEVAPPKRLTSVVRWRPSTALAIGIGAYAFVAVYLMHGTSEFLYFQF